jgi:hypothetical protein
MAATIATAAGANQPQNEESFKKGRQRTPASQIVQYSCGQPLTSPLDCYATSAKWSESDAEIASMSRARLNRQPNSAEPSLEHMFDVTEEADGSTTFCSSIKRGLLSLDFVERVDEKGLVQRPPLSVKAKFMRLAIVLRGLLKKAGCPTDLEYVWISVAGGKWYYDKDPNEELGGQPYELGSWHEQLLTMTEPLSENRLRGDLLHAIDQLLRRDLKPDLLENIWSVMQAYGDARIAGKVNRLASRGMLAEKSLAKGPKARNEQATIVLDLVCKHVESFWRRKAALRGNKTVTAEEIACEVNDELRSLGHRPLRPKTIADYISKGISGRLLRTG